MDRKNGIDLFRFIGAFFIMLLHTEYGALDLEYANNLRLLARWAVPFYFMTTGFFMGSKINESGILNFEKIEKNIASLITILLIANIIYLPIALLRGTPSLRTFNASYFVLGMYFHLWFIGAMLLGYIFIWYFYFVKRSKFLPIVSILILIAALMTNSYDHFIGKFVQFAPFRSLLSIPFMYFGILISKRKYSPNQIKLFLGLIALGVIIQIAEANLFKTLFNYSKWEHQFLIGTILIVIPLFITCTLIDARKSKFTEWGKKYSLFIFLYHPLVYLFLNLVLSTFLPHQYAFIKMFYPLIGFIIILGLSMLLNKYFKGAFQLLNGDLSIVTGANKV